MDEQSLYQLEQSTVVIVPTRSLAHHLQERVAAQQVERGVTVWEAPNIFSWAELLRDIWQHNRAAFDNSHTVLSSQQSLLLWNQVIDGSKRADHALTLLNVQQTARAAQRSDRLMADWLCDARLLAQDHVSDIEQFLAWRAEYEQKLQQRGVLDEPRLQAAVLSLAVQGRLSMPFSKLVWYAYDLLTAAQQGFNTALESNGLELEFSEPSVREPKRTYTRYQHDQDELESIFADARKCVEENPQQLINIVIPDLQHRYSQVQEIARQTFYPNSKLTDIQNNHSVYRFSLGRAMLELPAIEAAVCALKLLRSRVSLSDLSFLFRSVYIGATREYADECAAFERWLRRHRIRTVNLEQLPNLLLACYAHAAKNGLGFDEPKLPAFIDCLLEQRQINAELLAEQKEKHGFNALYFTDWVGQFSQWLSLWKWQSHSLDAQLTPFAYQLMSRWQSLLEEFASLGTVQRRIGLNKALDSFQQLIRDTVFLPKSAASPIVISGVLEALGRETDLCFLAGMTQEFPPAAKNDAFLPNRHLLLTGYPDASAQTSVVQAQKVMRSLQDSAREVRVSYAETDLSNPDVFNQASPLLSAEFGVVDGGQALRKKASQHVQLQHYQDLYGPAWPAPELARGGSAIFKNQSHCAFKAFATHQLGFDVREEPEFGLDPLDRGNVAHRMLELFWAKVRTQKALLEMSGDEQYQLVEEVFEQLLELSSGELSADKMSLLGLERRRVVELVQEWLEAERKRPVGFEVVERESRYRGEWGGIGFDYVIDRVDVADDGSRVIVDYKTGNTNRNDWLGERLKEPQLPLYALARDLAQPGDVSGISFGHIKRGKSDFVELAEAGIFRQPSRYTLRYQEQWNESRPQWPGILDRLASEFLAGHADVNPIDKLVCTYCELGSVCRVQELRARKPLPVLSAADGAVS